MIPLVAVALILGLVASAASPDRGVYAIAAPACPPSPIAVLDQLARQGAQPPPMVIMCAIAQAEAAGRPDLAEGIIATFVEPVVRASGRVLPVPAPARALPAPMPRRAPREVPLAVPEMTDDELHAAIATVATAAPARELVPAMASSSSSGIGRSSPIDGVPADKWSAFVGRLARETPAFCNERHVGAYRQRKDRLAELGIDPDRVLGSLSEQRAALEKDLADAYEHIQGADMDDGLGQYVSRLIAVPGQPDGCAVTLSGVLGVVQAAGLEGAAGWFETPADRKRYPHTTAAFLRCNGVF